MNDPDQAVGWPVGIGNDLSESLWAYDGFSGTDEQLPINVTSGFTSLGFIKTALRRSARLWCLLAVVGVLIGAALYKEFPPAYQASTSVLIIDNPNQDPMIAIQNDISLAESHTVAQRVVQQLGLTQTVSSFLAAYTVSAVTDQVLLITVGAPSSNGAVSRAAAIATQFLKFHGQYAQTQQQQLASELSQQVSQAQQNLSSINQEISQVAATASQAKLKNLRTQSTDASNALAQIQQYATSSLASGRTTTSSIVNGSQVLNPATPIVHSRLKGATLYVAGGLIGGLAVGMGIVVIAALVSDRLRRRDDIAEAIGAPVRLSVGTMRGRRFFPSLPGRSRARDRNMKLVVTHMNKCVPGALRGRQAWPSWRWTIEQVVAPAVVSLAVSSAKQGRQVVVADLSSGASAGRLLGVKDPGIREVTQDGVRLKVVIPDHDDAMPIGPLQNDMAPAQLAQANEALTAACASADLLVTLVTLDPAVGGDHLATWATDVVAVVTAGQSSGVKVHAAGEMIRLAGTRLDSVVLLDADKNDESLGAIHVLDEFTSAGPV